MENKLYDLKTEIKLQKAINKIFPIQDENNFTDQEIKERGYIALIDPANICMIIAKTYKAKMCIKRFTNTEINTKIPNMDYTIENLKGAISNYPTEYFLKAIQIFSILGESFTLSINDDYPATLESEDFRVIIAPRVKHDE